MIEVSQRALERARELLARTWDIHVHVAPGLFPRWGAGRDLVQACTATGTRGLVREAHHDTTVEVAARALHPRP